MGILKSVFKVLPLPPPLPLIQCCELITLLKRKFCSLFLNIVKREKGRETPNCPNSSFSHNVVIDHKRKNYNSFFKEISENKILK